MPAGLTIVFDTDCVLCAGWVHFVLRHERAGHARFVSAWSGEGQALAARHGLAPEELDRTFLVITTEGRALLRSDAAFAILRGLSAPWSWLSVLGWVPRPARDGVYGIVARNRYRWFGRRAQCFLPPAEEAYRFVSGPPRDAVNRAAATRQGPRAPHPEAEPTPAAESRSDRPRGP